MKARLRWFLVACLVGVWVIACAGASPAPVAPAGPETGDAAPPPAPDSTDPETAASFEDSRPPVRFAVLDVDTGKPIAGAVVAVAGQEALSDSGGFVELRLRFARSERATIRHPKYISFKGMITDRGASVYLRARSPATFAEVTATGKAQVVRVGNVTLDIPAGALEPGQRLDFGLLDPRSMPRAEHRPAPNTTIPLALEQLSVDVPGTDSRRFAKVIAPGTKIRATWKLKPDDLADLVLAGPLVTLSAGPYVHSVPSSGLAIDAKKSEVSFDIRHFSDVTITQKAYIDRDATGKAVALHWWRTRDEHVLEQRNPKFLPSYCTAEARTVSNSDTDIEQRRVTGSYATSWRVGVKLDAALLGGVEGGIVGNSGKAMAGMAGSLAWDTTSGDTSGFQFQTANRITVTRTRTCPAWANCGTWLYLNFRRDTLTIDHFAILLADLEANEEFKNVQDLARRMQPQERTWLTGDARLEEWRRVFNLDPRNQPPPFVESITKHETFTSEVRSFVDAYMILEVQPPLCTKTGAEGGAPEAGAPEAGRPHVFSQPLDPVITPCEFTHAVAPATLLGQPGVDPLVYGNGQKVFDRKVGVEGAEVEITVTARSTRVVGPPGGPPREVARAVACCPDDTDKVSFTSEVSLMINGGEAGGYNAGFSLGYKGSDEFTEGVDLLSIVKIEAHEKLEFNIQAGINRAWNTALQEATTRVRSSAVDVSARATRSTCSTVGLFAHLYETTFDFHVRISKGVFFDNTHDFTATMIFYGSAVPGPELTFAHCSEATGHKHVMTDPGQPVRPRAEVLTPRTPTTPVTPVDRQHSMVPTTPGTFCAALEAGTIGQFGENFGAGELALQADGCLKILPSGKLYAVVTPAWYHGPNGFNTFVFPAGVEGVMPVEDLAPGVAPNVALFGRAEIGYALSTSTAAGVSNTDALLLQPEVGGRVRAGEHGFFAVTPLSFPIFIGGATSPSVAYRLTVTGGALF